jgi:hypothetical protein
MELYKYFLKDLTFLLKERLERAKEAQIASKTDEFAIGVSMGIYECLDLIKQQAEAFEIPLKELGLDDYPLENYL